MGHDQPRSERTRHIKNEGTIAFSQKEPAELSGTDNEEREPSKFNPDRIY